MTGKYPLIAGAVVAALAVCGSASAANSYMNPSAVPANNRLYSSGSTALDNGIKDFLTLSNAAGGMCVNNTMDVYYDGASYVSGTHQYAVTCTTRIDLVSTDGTHKIPAGSNIAFFKDGSGGSFEGTKPEADQSARTYLDIFSGTFNCLTNGVPFDTNNNSVPYFTHSMPSGNAQEHANCTPSDTSAIPQIGFADVNDDMFTAQAGYPGLTPLTPGELGKLTGHAVWQQEFGIAVSLNLYRVLQAAQGKSVGSDAAVDMPSMSKSMLASIAAGIITDASQILDPSGANPITAAGFINANGTAPGTLNGGLPLAGTGADTSAAPSVTSLFWCRRADVSGSEASVQQYLLNNQCGATGVAGSSSGAPMATNTSTPASAAACNGFVTGTTVDENGCKWQNGAGTVPNSHLADVNIGATIYPANATGDVASCLNAHDYTDSYALGILSGDTLYDDTNVSPTGHPTWGWGGSKDNSNVGPPSNAATKARWRYIAIDDKKPNLESVASGTYDFVEDNELYWNQAAINALGNTTGGLGNNYNAMLGFIQTLLATPSVVGDIEQPQAHGTTGGILDPLNANGATPNTLPLTVAITSNPVSSVTLQLSGGVQDCGQRIQVTPVLNNAGGAMIVPSATGYQDGKTAGKGVPTPL